MKDLQSKVEMVQLKLIRSVFAVNVDFPSSEDRVAIGVSLKNNGEFLEDGQRANFLQRLKTGDPTEAPFFLDVEFGAFLALSPAPLPLERPYYIQRILPQIIFPYMREYVAETTRRGGFTPLIINQNLFEEDEEPPVQQQAESQKFLH